MVLPGQSRSDEGVMKKFLFLALMIFGLLTAAGCSAGNTEQGEKRTAANMPLPQVRVVPMPTATPAPTGTPTQAPPASATAPQLQYYIEPTPDEDAIASEIQGLMDEIDRKLQSMNFSWGQ